LFDRLSGRATPAWHHDLDFGQEQLAHDTAMVETFFKTLKSELIWRTTFYTRADAKQASARYIDGFYNTVRRRSALDQCSTVHFERTAIDGADASPLYRGKSDQYRAP
jgi:transposase InsO family protein